MEHPGRAFVVLKKMVVMQGYNDIQRFGRGMCEIRHNVCDIYQAKFTTFLIILREKD